MKRDIGAIRHILLCIESIQQENTSEFIRFNDERISSGEYTDSVIAGHLILLSQKGFITVKVEARHFTMTFPAITWEGYDFLDTVRNQVVWEKTKNGLQRVGGLAFDLVLDLGKAYAKRLVKDNLSIDI